MELPKSEKAKLYLNRGIAFQSKGEYIKAIEDLNESISLDQNNWSAFNSRGERINF